MNHRSKYLLKNVISFAFGKMGTRLINFFLVPLYTYALSKEEYGVIDLVVTLGTVLVPILILDISEAIMRFCLDKGAEQSKIMSTGIVILGMATVVGLAALLISRLIPSLELFGTVLYAYLMSAAYMQVFCSFLRGQEKLNAYAIVNIFHTAIVAGLNILFLVVFEWGIQGYLYANVIANLVCTVIAAIVARVDVLLKEFCLDKKLTKAMIRYSVLLIPNSLMWWIINSSDRIMVTLMVGAAANGIYAVSYKVPSLLHSLTGIFNQAWSYSAVKEEDSSDKESYYNTIYHHMVQLLSIMTAGILMVIKPFLTIYVADEYYPAWKYTPFLLIGFMFLSLATFLATSYTVHKNSMGYLLSGIIGAVLNVLLNCILIPCIGVMGAAIATCCSYVAVFVFRVFHTRKYIRINVLRPTHLICYALLIVMCFALFIDGVVGQLCLTGLFVVVFCFSKDIVFQLLKKFLRRS